LKAVGDWLVRGVCVNDGAKVIGGVVIGVVFSIGFLSGGVEIPKLAQGCVVGVSHNDVVEDFDF